MRAASLRDGLGVRTENSFIRRYGPRLLAAGIIAATLLIGIVTVWMLNGDGRTTIQEDPVKAREPAVVKHRKTTPSTFTQAIAKSGSTANEPLWDDSLDEQFSQIDLQMQWTRNQLSKTDAFGQVQYRMEQFRQAIQAETL